MLELKKGDMDKLNKCYVCGAPISSEGNSFHVWDVTYECGCIIMGVIDGSADITVDVECPNKK